MIGARSSLRNGRADVQDCGKPGTRDKVSTGCHLCSASAEMLLETAEPESPLVDASASDDGSAVSCNRKHKPSAAAKLDQWQTQRAAGQTVSLHLTCRQHTSMQTLALSQQQEKKRYLLHCSSNRAVNVKSGSNSCQLPDVSADNALMPMSRRIRPPNMPGGVVSEDQYWRTSSA